MARVLIIVHGMGVNQDGWGAGIVAKLNSAAERYAVFNGLPPVFVAADGPDDDTTHAGADQVLVVPVGYDDVMRSRVDSFQNDVSAITAFASNQGIPLPNDVKKVLKTFENAGATEKNFFWSHVVDVLLYRYFSLVTTPVRVKVMAGIAKVLERMDDTVSIMGHSLGTAVVHDSLSLMGSGQHPEFGALLPPGTRFANIHMVANVSRVLEKALNGDHDVYESCVCPVSVHGPSAYCHDFFNFRHMLDPFTIPKRFEPQWIGDDFHPVDRLLHLTDFNVHGWQHYLDSPEVHIPIINSLFGFKVITDTVAHAAVANYLASPVPLCAKGMEFWTDQTRAIEKRLSERPTVAELLLAAAKFFAVVQAARAKCGQPANIPGLTSGGIGDV